MRIEKWDMRSFNSGLTKEGHRRAKKAAEVIAQAARAECPIGTIERPMYKTGPYAGQPWTARDYGQLKKSVRVTERHTEKYGFVLAQFENLGVYGNVRVYAGNYLAYYAAIVEFSNHFMRRALARTRSQVKNILENG